MSLVVGAYIVNFESNRIQILGQWKSIDPILIQLLRILVNNKGKVVLKTTIQREVWPGERVGDTAITTAIAKLRKLLKDNAHSPAYVETVARKGYRLIAKVEPLNNGVIEN